MKNLLPLLFLSFLGSLQLEAMNASRRGSSFFKKEETNVSSSPRTQNILLQQKTHKRRQYNKTSSMASEKVGNDTNPLTSSIRTRKPARKPSIP